MQCARVLLSLNSNFSRHSKCLRFANSHSFKLLVLFFFVVVFSSYLFCCYLVCCYLVVPTAKFTYRPFLEYWLLVSKTWFRECWTLSYGWYELRFAVQRKHLCKGSVKCYRYLWLKTINRRAYSSPTLNKYPYWSYFHQSPRQYSLFWGDTSGYKRSQSCLRVP